MGDGITHSRKKNKFDFLSTDQTTVEFITPDKEFVNCLTDNLIKLEKRYQESKMNSSEIKTAMKTINATLENCLISKDAQMIIRDKR